jgi:hypothetical protein
MALSQAQTANIGNRFTMAIQAKIADLEESAARNLEKAKKASADVRAAAVEAYQSYVRQILTADAKIPLASKLNVNIKDDGVSVYCNTYNCAVITKSELDIYTSVTDISINIKPSMPAIVKAVTSHGFADYKSFQQANERGDACDKVKALKRLLIAPGKFVSYARTLLCLKANEMPTDAMLNTLINDYISVATDTGCKL